MLKKYRNGVSTDLIILAWGEGHTRTFANMVTNILLPSSLPSVMQCRVVRINSTDISEEQTASIFKVGE
jgi:hypothetical protein